MLRFLIPQFARRDLPPMIGVAVVGAIAAGVYGVLHDQVTFTISDEYLTKLKFDQYHYANFGYPVRVFVAEVGFLATWWVGFFCAWFLARRLIPGQPRRTALRQIAIGFAIIFACALLSASIGYVYRLWREPNADYSVGRSSLQSLGIEDHRAFIRVACIHNASYVGGIAGLLLALIVLRPDRSSTTNCPA